MAAKKKNSKKAAPAKKVQAPAASAFATQKPQGLVRLLEDDGSVAIADLDAWGFASGGIERRRQRW